MASKSKIIFIIAHYKTSPTSKRFEQLPRSISWRVMYWGGTHPRLAFVGVEFLPIFVF